jgi:hypothetical protein
MDITRNHDDRKEIPGADFYHDVLVINKDIKRLLDEQARTPLTFPTSSPPTLAYERASRRDSPQGRRLRFS